MLAGAPRCELDQGSLLLAEQRHQACISAVGRNGEHKGPGLYCASAQAFTGLIGLTGREGGGCHARAIRTNERGFRRSGVRANTSSFDGSTDNQASAHDCGFGDTAAASFQRRAAGETREAHFCARDERRPPWCGGTFNLAAGRDRGDGEVGEGVVRADGGAGPEHASTEDPKEKQDPHLRPTYSTAEASDDTSAASSPAPGISPPPEFHTRTSIVCVEPGR